MKKTLTVLLLTVSATAFAHGPHGPHGYWRRDTGGWGWVAPVIIGGAIGYELSRPSQPIVVTQQPPIVIQQPQFVQQQNCSPWTEIRNPDGTITVTRTCNQ
jgi:hypothetical protein